MSESPDRPSGMVDGSVLQDQIDACDEIVREIVDTPREASDDSDERDPYDQADEIYQRVRQLSVRSFEDRFQTSALYSALKLLFRRIGDERGYEQRMHYQNHRGEERVADSIDSGLYWFKLYAGVLLERQPAISYEWAVPHFKQHRDLVVSHPTEMEPLRDGPDPTLVSSVVPLWYVLEDILRLWREILDIDSERRTRREQILHGEDPNGEGATSRFGFIRDLDHQRGGVDAGYITGFRNGESGKGSRFEVGNTDFFPSIGDVVRFQAEQRTNRDGREFSTLTVTDTVSLVE